MKKLFPAERRRLRDSRLAKWNMILREISPAHSFLDKVLEGHPVDSLDCSWKRRGQGYPYSCTDEEGMILHETIATENLKSGFEIATAFGYSTLFAAIALKRNTGQIQTLDCYVEEKTDRDDYSPEEMKAAVALVRSEVAEGKYPNGLSIAKHCAAAANVFDTINYHVGLSPNDVAPVLNGRTIDYAFIDGGHIGEQPLLDFRAVEPFLGPRCAVFFHDDYATLGVAAAIAAAEKSLGRSAHSLRTRHHLTLVSRGLSDNLNDRLDRLCFRELNPDSILKKLIRKSRSLVGRSLRAITRRG